MWLMVPRSLFLRRGGFARVGTLCRSPFPLASSPCLRPCAFVIESAPRDFRAHRWWYLGGQAEGERAMRTPAASFACSSQTRKATQRGAICLAFFIWTEDDTRDLGDK
jgi:hypothetical protein